MGSVIRYLSTSWSLQRGALFPWVPVCLAIGISVFFTLRFEPDLIWLWLVGGCGGLGIILGLRPGLSAGPLFLAVACLALGFALAGARAHWVAAPVLKGRYYGPVVGRIVAIDRSANDALRLRLDQVHLPRETGPVPDQVRMALYGPPGYTDLTVGARVMMIGHVSPPPGPAEPYGFDFRRHAWFQGLGGVGYTRTPVVGLMPDAQALPLQRFRQALSQRVQDSLQGAPGAMAAAIITGDRSALSQPVLQDLRDSNLAHLLAISGLHMGLLAGAVFAGLRLGLVVLPGIGMRPWVKKVAALGALAAAAGYLALSGGNVATQRAFVMVAVALGAVLLDRRVLSLRSVAVAATIVLVLRPEALMGPGFQMSFAATTALVLVFGLINAQPKSPWFKRIYPVLTVVVSSAVAGAATAPVAMAHFNQVAHYGLIANISAVPLMGIIVIPAGLVSALLMPFGWEGPALWVMGLGIRWILWVAGTVADWPAALSFVAQPAPGVLGGLALAGCWLAIWQGSLRWVSVPAAAVAVGIWAVTPRPELLIARDGGLVGVTVPEGRALSRDRTAKFVASLWLENDGSGVPQAQAAAYWSDDLRTRVMHITGKAAAAKFLGCTQDQIIVSNAVIDGAWPCDIWDAPRLRTTGAVAGYRARDNTLRFVTTVETTGSRLWSP